MNEITEDGKSILYRTSDIYFAAYLCAVDIPMETTEIDKTSSNRKIVFIFRIPSKKDLERLKAGFFGGSANVQAMKFVQAIRSLKSLCFV